MAKYIQSRGNVISGKYEKGLLYQEKQYKAIGIYKTELKEMSLTAKLSDDGINNYRDYLNEIRYFSITSNSIISATTLGSFEENNSEAIDAVGRWFGTGAALVTSQMLKGKNHIVRVEYKDHTSSTLCIDDYLYQTFIVIASEIEKEEPDNISQVRKEVDNSNTNTIKSISSDNKETINSQSSNIHTPININPNNPDATIDRIELFIEDGDWESAKVYCNAGLDYFPKDYRLYKLALLIDHKSYDLAKLVSNLSQEELKTDSNYKRAIRFGDNAFIEELELAKIKLQAEEIEKKKEQDYKDKKAIYDNACIDLLYVKNYNDCKLVASSFKSLNGFENSEGKLLECKEKAKMFAEKEVESLKEDTKKHEYLLNNSEQEISILNKEIQAAEQEVEEYVSGIDKDIDAKENKIKMKRYETIEEINSIQKKSFLIKQSLKETREEYNKVKASFFKNSIKRELQEKITSLENELNESETKLNELRQNKLNLDKELNENNTYREIINNKKTVINNDKLKINSIKLKIAQSIAKIEQNKKEIETLIRNIENNELFS